MASELSSDHLRQMRRHATRLDGDLWDRFWLALLDEHAAQKQRIATLEAAVKQLEQRVHEREKEIDRLAYGRANVDF